MPLSPQLLQQITHAILASRLLCQRDRYLYASVITTAYFGCLRASEITYLSLQYYNCNMHLTLEVITIEQNSIQLRVK